MPIYEKNTDTRITLASKYSEYRPKSRKRVKVYNISKFIKSKINTVYFFYKSFFILAKINKKDRIHAINIHSYYHDLITPLLLHFFFKIPLLIKPPSDFTTQQREIFISKPSSFFSKMAYYGWMKFFRTLIVRRKKIFFQAIKDEIYEDLIKLKVRKKNIIRVPNGISIDTYVNIKKHNKKETHFGFVGRLIRSKNINFLLNSFKTYLSEYKNDKLLIFGKGPEQKFISNFIITNKLTKNIILKGFEQRKDRIYSNIDVLIHPTFGEGCPNTILESGLSKTFIIASNVSGIKNIIINKKLGLLFNPFKEDDLVKKLIYYKKHQELVPGILESAKDSIIKKFDVNIIANRIYEFLKSKLIYKKRKEALKISILSLVFPYPKGGIMPGVENYVENFAVPLKKLGHDVNIITTYWNGRKKYDYYKGIPIIRILDSKALFGKIGSIFHLNNFTFGLNLILKKNFKFYQDSDVVIIPLAIGFNRFFKLKKIPVISCFLHYDRKISLVNQFNLPFYHYLEKKQFNKHKNILSISNHSKRDIMKFYKIDEKHINVIPVGINTEKFNTSNFSKEIRKKYGDNILLCVGPFLRRKRIDILLEAMTYVIKVIPDVNLILAGKGLLLKNLIKLSNSLGIQKNTNFLGFVETETLSRYYASCDIFIHPSEFEGFGQVLLESIASGTPCICANQKPMSEIVGKVGKTFKVNNPMDLSKIIIDLLTNREKLSDLKKNISVVTKKYNSINLAKDLTEYIKKTIKNYCN